MTDRYRKAPVWATVLGCFFAVFLPSAVYCQLTMITEQTRIPKFLLRMSLPTIEEIDAAGTGKRPMPWSGEIVSSQSIRVIGEENDKWLLTGKDAFGDTQVEVKLKKKSDGTEYLDNYAGIPNTRWILSPDKQVTLDLIKIKGLTLDVGVKDFVWLNPSTQTTTNVNSVLHVEITNTDKKRPGTLVFLKGKTEITYKLHREKGVFIFSILPDGKRELVKCEGIRPVH